MRRYIKQSLYAVPCFIFADVWSQQKITGSIIDNNGSSSLNSVLVVNISNHTSSLSNASGQFVIDADENDEIRFVKEGYYRIDRKITKEDVRNPLLIVLPRAEILIPEVQIKYQPTGNLERDSKHLDESRKLASLKSNLDDYMRSPLNEPLPKNTIPKQFGGHDFASGQGDVLGVLGLAVDLIKKSGKPKITKPDYNETQNFIKRVKQEMNLGFLRKYGMDDEKIDRFLLYANDNKKLAKLYRKDFNVAAIEFELKAAFQEYKKTHKLEN
jgi:hypothetical protein